MAKIDNKAFNTMTAVADKTNVDIKKEVLCPTNFYQMILLRIKNL